VVVVASDGLFDNLYDNEISQTVVDVLKVSTRSVQDAVNAIAKQLVDAAYDVSVTTVRGAGSPFASRAIESGFQFRCFCVFGLLMSLCSGGKKDDISVVVGMVVEQEDSPDRR
jgi:hypothetical protein